MRRTLFPIVAAGLLLAGCGNGADTDRQNRNPDQMGEVTDVRVYTNIDNAPNIVTFCVAGLYLISTLSGKGAATIIRVPERDVDCGGKPR